MPVRAGNQTDWFGCIGQFGCIDQVGCIDQFGCTAWQPTLDGSMDRPRLMEFAVARYNLSWDVWNKQWCMPSVVE